MPSTDTALASAVHDPDGNLVAAVERLSTPLTDMFSRIALNVSDASAPALVEAVRSLRGAKVVVHPANEATIGKARRDAVRLALDCPTILLSDLDHLLRWIEHGGTNLANVLQDRPDLDFLVVGRSARALSAGPRRLQETERLVNHIYTLMTGKSWDLMFAVRRMSSRAAATIVTQSTVDTLANDVEWPLLARQAGLSVGYAESDALFYRAIEEFGAPADTGDDDPLQWIRRLEFAGLMASAVRPFLKEGRYSSPSRANSLAITSEPASSFAPRSGGASCGRR
ncbi:hypothetical protein [Devosia nitrariae]|uniref:Glycosyl transferase family 2 n=1 Tax=Devosia nitrariae TaxID=2071872 RepID=A0ABQ5WBH7_9HYPH|nr:hypothetical protein [Devosia nitrariae]GLQ57485.1 hypothetical protein GCM10010862_47440 [Devosia nitrariae]